ncbi:glycosyltransferase family 2 protein [Agromyces larvae]|uniref:Glycosyltransferase n=1 Tax=Agromyces larvae TaxID=2929802 RepID=A0ABY4BZC1_9MICO|nr:glycosyltransferase [Agromyces larvae]UOE44508.1 glycosyltransferase [Agromyces larvae]
MPTGESDLTVPAENPHTVEVPFLDILMPFWGDPGQFRDAVESVLAQTDPGWTLMVIDDAYPDRSPGEWVRALEHPRVHYRRNAVNLGVSGNFREAARVASAPYTTVMGCDDLLLPGYVERIRQLVATHPEAAYVQPGVEVIDGEGRVTAPLADRVKSMYRPRVNPAGPVELSGERLATSLLRANWTYFPSIAWRTDLLKRFDFRDDYEVVLDLALQIEIVREGGILVLDDRPEFRYRRHAASASAKRATEGSRFQEERRYFSEAARAMHEQGWGRAARAASRRLTSRLNALSVLPSALVARNGAAARTLLRHGLGR